VGIDGRRDEKSCMILRSIRGREAAYALAIVARACYHMVNAVHTRMYYVLVMEHT
jgi:hypothetical protein